MNCGPWQVVPLLFPVELADRPRGRISACVRHNAIRQLVRLQPTPADPRRLPVMQQFLISIIKHVTYSASFVDIYRF
jgi:hypothetical protein